MKNLLEVNDIHVYIGAFYILQGVSLVVPKGEVTVLLGRNGSGKTTAMKSILGLYPPRKGKISFKNEEISGKRTYEIINKGIGYVPDTRRIFGTLTVEQNLIVAMRKGAKTPQERFELVFNLFPDLKRFFKQKAKTLSGGQQQMLAVARALVNDNDLLLIDEPTEGLSPVLAKSLVSALEQLKQYMTILLIEQNFRTVSALGDNFYIFDNGKIVHKGTNMDDLVDNKELVAKYLGVRIS
ncbi:MAG: ABC transporter ATP-binding protein [Candidatus Odinarchaeota archaeon]